MAYDTKEAEHILSLSSARITAGHKARQDAAGLLFQEFVARLGDGKVSGMSVEGDSETNTRIHVTFGSSVHVDLVYERGAFRAYLMEGGKPTRDTEIPLVLNATTGEYESTKDETYYVLKPGETQSRRSALAEIAEAVDSLVRPYVFVGD